MNFLPLALPAALACPFISPAFAEEAETSPHYAIAEEIVEVLSRTELLLNACRDEASVESAVPRLRELARQMGDVVERQNRLPEPTVEDTRQVNALAGEFHALSRSIQDHVRRLSREGLYSDALAEVLRIRVAE